MPIYDVKCGKCGTIEEDAVLGIEEEPEACEACGSNRHKMFSTLGERETVGFKDMDMGYGTIDTSKEAFEARIARMKVENPGCEIRVSGWDKQATKVRAEERKHRAWSARKARGVDDGELRERAAAPRGTR